MSARPIPLAFDRPWPARLRPAVLLPGLLLVVLAGLVAWPPARVSAQPLTFAPVVKAQQAKVVHVTTTTRSVDVTTPLDNQQFRFPDPNHGSGSGFIISPDGYIVTNHHVVENADSIEVVLADERKFPAEIVGLDAQTDLALLKIDATGLPAVKFGDSNKLRVGDWVIAIGNPLGLDHTVTAGIISAKGRNIFQDENLAYGEFLQTDAAINPGNSGGPLFNLKGEVVGVNTAISRRGWGIGFAVPSNLVVKVVAELRKFGRVNRGWLGVVITELTPESVLQRGLPDGTRGVVIDEILPNSPALSNGLRKGDVLTGFDSQHLRRVAQLQKLVALTLPGTGAELEGLRRENADAPWTPLKVHVRIAASPGEDLGDQPSLLFRLGLSALNLPEAVRRKANLSDDAGVLVESIVSGSAAEAAGLQAGDIILEVNHSQVASRLALETALLQARKKSIALVVRRSGTILNLVIVQRIPQP